MSNDDAAVEIKRLRKLLVDCGNAAEIIWGEDNDNCTDDEGAAIVSSVNEFKSFWRLAEKQIADLKARIANDDKVLRASLPDRWAGCTSSVGGAQSYISELEGMRDDLKARLSEFEDCDMAHKLEEVRQERDDLKARLESGTDLYKSVRDEIRAEIGSRVRELEDETRALAEQRDAAIRERDRMREELDDARNDSAVFRAAKQRSESALAKLTDTRDVEIARDLVDIETERDEARKDCEAAIASRQEAIDASMQYLARAEKAEAERDAVRNVMVAGGVYVETEAIKIVTKERDAAIRERDELHAELAELGETCSLLERERDEARAEVTAYKEAHDDHKRLVRELDVALNGDGAAKQASLCDIVAQVKGDGLSFAKCSRLVGLLKEVLAEWQCSGTTYAVINNQTLCRIDAEIGEKP